MSLLEARGLTKRFGGVLAVDGVDLEVARGEVVALIGPNGAGKSTCFAMLMGQLEADAGTVAVMGRNVTGWPPRRIWRLGVGRTFQITATFASFSVIENLQLAILSHRRRLGALIPRAAPLYREAAMSMLRRVGLEDAADRPCRELAYGDQKRAELALALANEPALLLMDEPTAGMAPAERLELMGLVASLAREREMGILFTEHDVDVVFGNAQRVLVMAGGRLIAAGPPEEVRADATVQRLYLGETAATADG